MVQYLFVFVLTTAFLLSNVSSRPSNNESPLKVEIPVTNTDETVTDHQILQDSDIEIKEGNTGNILDKIQGVNDALKKPILHRYRISTPKGGSFIVAAETLEKIKNAIDSGKLDIDIDTKEETNMVQNKEESQRYVNSRAAKFRSNLMNMGPNVTPFPYMTNIPVLIIPYNVDNNRIDGYDDLKQTQNDMYQTRRQPIFNFPSLPSLPSFPFQNFQLQWPFAQYFPLIIKDPFLTLSQGGGWNNLFEYGQSADVCSRKQKSVEDIDNTEEVYVENIPADETNLNPLEEHHTREGRALKKRTINNNPSTQQVDSDKKAKKIYVTKPVTTNTRKTTKKPYIVEEIEEQKDEESGDLRFPFSDFGWFGNKKPVAPSPGFFINKLRVRKGGVAIAGPGGVATAGRGGTAIVGPGGLAYTQPGGLAVAGPAARVVALSPDVDLHSLITRIQQDSTVPRSKQPIREGKLVATGPVVYYHPNEQTYADPEEGPVSLGRHDSKDTYYYNGMKFIEKPIRESKFVLYVDPQARAVSGNEGSAIANPISYVFIRGGEKGSVVHKPLATAVAGPGGIAHALSELYVYEDNSYDSTLYLPFYGGAKEESITNENVFKSNDDNLQAKMFATNLSQLKSLSSTVLRIYNLGKRLGYLSDREKERFETQLGLLEETASNTVKIIDDIGGDVNVLFKKNKQESTTSTSTTASSLKSGLGQRKYGENYDDDVGEEGISIAAPDNDDSDVVDDVLERGTVSEAKPIGLAVVGENGIAASRPMATAVAASGVAIARPIATAIAGLDPTLLGIDFQLNHYQKSYKIVKKT
ncbi:unnamed protein product [Leptosia nina]|uniref:DUF4774 domain-containing protein n=1 Tax=Leptosia nina TaxID=320188 RepID=A0AAV1JSJ6_9NEOP